MVDGTSSVVKKKNWTPITFHQPTLISAAFTNGHKFELDKIASDLITVFYLSTDLWEFFVDCIPRWHLFAVFFVRRGFDSSNAYTVEFRCSYFQDAHVHDNALLESIDELNALQTTFARA